MSAGAPVMGRRKAVALVAAGVCLVITVAQVWSLFWPTHTVDKIADFSRPLLGATIALVSVMAVRRAPD